MVSLPDYDPNNPREAHDPDRINRLTTGVYEMGSTFKALTLAMALDSGKANLNSLFDARGRCTTASSPSTITTPSIGRSLTLPEVFTYLVQHRHRADGAERSASRRTRRS